MKPAAQGVAPGSSQRFGEQIPFTHAFVPVHAAGSHAALQM
jgi:hypothetical protein